MEYEKELGIIDYVHLGWEDHGIFTFYIGFNFGGRTQAFGGYALDDYDKEKETRVGTAFGLQTIMRIMKVANVNDWKDLVGRELFVLRDHSRGTIRGIMGPPYRGGGAFIIQDLVDEINDSLSETVKKEE